MSPPKKGYQGGAPVNLRTATKDPLANTSSTTLVGQDAVEELQSSIQLEFETGRAQKGLCLTQSAEDPPTGTTISATLVR